MPVVFLIHEIKFQSAHEELMKHVSVIVPSLNKCKTPIPIVTDDELGMYNAIDKHLPSLTHLKCWNHTINSIKVQLYVMLSLVAMVGKVSTGVIGATLYNMCISFSCSSVNCVLLKCVYETAKGTS